MCGSSPEKVEIIEPPAGSVKGERIVFDEYPGELSVRVKQQTLLHLHCSEMSQ